MGIRRCFIGYFIKLVTELLQQWFRKLINIVTPYRKNVFIQHVEEQREKN